MSTVGGCKEYRLAEYNALMAKLDHSLKDLSNSEVIFLSSMMLFYAWVFKDGAGMISTSVYLLYIPIAVPIIAIFRFSFRYSYISALEGYIAMLESHMFPGEAPEGLDPDTEPRGWERSFKTSGFILKSYRFVRFGLWAALAAGSVWVAQQGPTWIANADRIAIEKAQANAQPHPVKAR